MEYRENGRLVCKGALAAVFNKGLIERTKQSWEAIDGEVKSCIKIRTLTTPTQFTEKCIGADDPKIRSHLKFCERMIAEAREARERDERRAAALRKAEAQKQAEILAALARAKERRLALIAKHGEKIAESILAGKLLKEMTGEQVVETLGEPRGKKIIPPDFELWVYEKTRVAFRDGKVTHFD